MSLAPVLVPVQNFRLRPQHLSCSCHRDKISCCSQLRVLISSYCHYTSDDLVAPHNLSSFILSSSYHVVLIRQSRSWHQRALLVLEFALLRFFINVSYAAQPPFQAYKMPPRQSQRTRQLTGKAMANQTATTADTATKIAKATKAASKPAANSSAKMASKTPKAPVKAELSIKATKPAPKKTAPKTAASKKTLEPKPGESASFLTVFTKR
jgi:hypothetical protein